MSEPKVYNFRELSHVEDVSSYPIEFIKYTKKSDYDLLKSKLDAAVKALEQIEKYFCACSIDDEIIPQVVAREALSKFANDLTQAKGANEQDRWTKNK